MDKVYTSQEMREAADNFFLQSETEKLKKERAEYGEPDTPEGCYEKDDHLLPKKRPLNKNKIGGAK